ncbi:uncharacterized protein LOC117603680 isoform X2 [Osmia lignaria lignaria]|uniref:uncharacterized protein LOC117603680 isoform X2 n=1 Tax=Osmia lignaria lignaria TaxID=1437193 RepID=UPI00147845A5|nr:uncharacterized protein LOC117603680 isoform X2 [Osmia lignaria]
MSKGVYTDFSIASAKYLSKYTGIWLPKNIAEERQRKVTVLYMTVALLYGIYVNVMDIYHTWPDPSHCMFLILNATCISVTIIKMLILNAKRAEFADVLLYAQRHFWHNNYDSEEQLIFSICVKYCTRFVMFAFLALPIALFGYVITPIIVNHGGDKSERVLPFKMWVDWPLTETPYYELMFIFQADVSPSMRIIFLFHMIGSLGYLCMLTYTCHHMMEESMNITTTIYLGFWSTLPMNKVGRSFRSIMKFIMIRSLKPCCLTAGGFFPVTMETFTTLLSSTFSYYTLMRQSFIRTEGE